MSKQRGRREEAAPVLSPPPDQLDVADLQLSSDEEYDSDASDPASWSGGDGGGEGVDREIEQAVLGYMAAAEQQRQRQQRGGDGSDR
jgi:hypothetical protein